MKGSSRTLQGFAGSPIAVTAEADLPSNIHSSLKIIHRVVRGLHFPGDLLLGMGFLQRLPFGLFIHRNYIELDSHRLHVHFTGEGPPASCSVPDCHEFHEDFGGLLTSQPTMGISPVLAAKVTYHSSTVGAPACGWSAIHQTQEGEFWLCVRVCRVYRTWKLHPLEQLRPSTSKRTCLQRVPCLVLTKKILEACHPTQVVFRWLFITVSRKQIQNRGCQRRVPG